MADLAGALWGLQRRLIYLPDTRSMPPAATVLPGAVDVELTTADELRLRAWWLPDPDDDGAPAVLVAQGNGGARDLRAPLARALADQGLSVLLFDYRGYGGNPGSPSEQGLALGGRAPPPGAGGKGNRGPPPPPFYRQRPRRPPRP